MQGVVIIVHTPGTGKAYKIEVIPDAMNPERKRFLVRFNGKPSEKIDGSETISQIAARLRKLLVQETGV